MEKEILQKLVESGLSSHQIAQRLSKSQTSVSYQLKKHQLKTNHRSFNKQAIYPVTNGMKECSKCHLLKSEGEFYRKYKNSNVKHNFCKSCSNSLAISKMISTKIKMIEYKGRECKNCGLQLEKSHYSVFDFHHRDSSTKDRSLKEMRSYSWDKIKNELDKCDLLCANCHRLEHAKLNSPVV